MPYAGTAHPLSTLQSAQAKAERNVVACALAWHQAVDAGQGIDTAASRLSRAVGIYLDASQRVHRRIAEDTDPLPAGSIAARKSDI